MNTTSHWISKKAIAWSLYDFADTAFSALFITFFFPILIKIHLGGTEFQIGLAMGLSVLVAAILVPVIGAISDSTGKRLPILIKAAIATAVLGVLAGYAPLQWALVFGFLANITHLISKDVYDAKMIDIVPRARFGSLSGLGVGVGYLGTIVSLAVAYILFSFLGWENITSIRAAFWESGVFYILFSLPIFFLVPDKVKAVRTSLSQLSKNAFLEVIDTVKKLHKFPVFGRFLAASFMYNNAMNTTIIFLALFALEVIGLSIQEFFPIFALMSITAAIGSLLFGKLSDSYGPIVLIKIVLIIWIAIILFLISTPSYAIFLSVGMIGGACLGAIWTLNRHIVAKVAPEENIAQFFGFEGLTAKFSGLIGPIIFGYLASRYSYTEALISVIVFFVIGLFLMRKLKSI